MQELIDNLILYHGSYCEVASPDLSKCSKYKDFGQGFYLTSSLKQAESFSKISLAKAISNNIVEKDKAFGIVSAYRFNSKMLLKIMTFPTANAEWLHCIVVHRSKKHSLKAIVDSMKNYDVICGKIANDNTNSTIAAYMNGIFGKIGSKSADDICVSLLLPERLQDQFCFRTDSALKCLTFIESMKIMK